MKPIVRFFLIFLLCGVLLVPARAANTDLTLSDGEAAAGEVVYLTLVLNKKTEGDAMGVEYSYDAKHLEAVPELCSWARSGSLKDFGLKGRGVWAAKNADTISGSICTLAFRIKPDASFSETAVSCTLVVKNGTEQTGEYTAEATVRIACSHSFTAWTEDGSAHSRSCEHCGLSHTQAHQWDQGVTQAAPQDSSKMIRLFTCAGCGATYQEEAAGSTPEILYPTDPTEPIPTAPEDSQPHPTVPDRVEPTYPTDPPQTQPQSPGQSQNPGQTQNPGKSDHPTQPTVSSGQDQSDRDHVHPTVSSQDGAHSPDDGHDHSSDVIYDSQGNILAVRDPNYQEETNETHSADDGHDHSGDQVLITDTQPRTDTTLVLAALAIVCIGAAVFFVKKKKR